METAVQGDETDFTEQNVIVVLRHTWIPQQYRGDDVIDKYAKCPLLSTLSLDTMPPLVRAQHVGPEAWSNFLVQAKDAGRINVRLRLVIMMLVLIIPMLSLALASSFHGQDGEFSLIRFYFFAFLAFLVLEPIYIYLQMKFIFGPIDQAMERLVDQWSHTFSSYGISASYTKDDVDAPPRLPHWIKSGQTCMLHFCPVNTAQLV
eukprot:scaffold4552_cov161-Amphora_coffeaeformis.AAC.8